MCSELVISASGLGKRYSIYAKPHHRLREIVSGSVRSSEFWALRHVDFDICKGETVGIIGRNGSGKSTLLQMLVGTLQPSEGQIQVKGRIAALLELGAGFNPDFTGRENVHLNAALLGMDSAEISERLEAILEFADIGEFIDQPVRTYSSGMFVRLAFAVAISAEPDVLVIDEALSVGDEVFQRKCFSRIEEMKRRGVTVLFVSHSVGAIVQLCDRAILLDRGERLLTGSPKQVVAMYQRLAYAPGRAREHLLREIRDLDALGSESDDVGIEAIGDAGPQQAPIEGNEAAANERFDVELKPESTISYVERGARIEAPVLLNDEGRAVNVLVAGRRYTYAYQVHFTRDAARVHFGMMVKSTSGLELAGMSSHAEGDAIGFVPAGTTMHVTFHFRASMLPGTYFLNAGCVGVVDGEGETFLHRLLDGAMFRIELPSSDRRLAGFFDLSEEPACTWQRLPRAEAGVAVVR